MGTSAIDLTAFPRLDGGGTSLILDLRSGMPEVLYWGAALPSDTNGEDLAKLLERQVPPASAAVPATLPLTPLMADGFLGPPGLRGHRDGSAWAPQFALTDIGQADGAIAVTSEDPSHQLRLVHTLRMHAQSGVLSGETCLTNLGADVYTLDHLAAPVLPLPQSATRITGLTGRWAQEFSTFSADVTTAPYVRENRRGRTSHDCFPGFFARTPQTRESEGYAAGFHLGASSNHQMRVWPLGDGRVLAEMADLLLPGEIRLEAGESYRSPILFAALSEKGFNGVSQAFHTFVRQEILPASVAARPRPIHYNTWEAVYFDHDLDTLKDLADRAADLGVERFILDDGWFGARRNDAAGLGDWTVSREIYPEGLAPLAQHVRAHGMEFGLWLEPEMVNPDSDLYRAHPEWVLQLSGVPQIPARNQVVLDLSRAEVRDHLFRQIDALLTELPIDYLKWDMNRDVHHPGNADGQPIAHAQTRAVYALIDQVRTAHPDVEIESCASGGGRADFEILKRTHRIWTSDSNDALDRLQIQRGFSMFFPAEIMGAHVGPRDCHITGRRLPMHLRVATALFGHMGLEMDLRELDEREAKTLQRGLALHKAHRDLIHSGTLLRLDLPSWQHGFGILAEDRSEALFSITFLESCPTSLPGRFRFAGLDPDQLYSLDCVWKPSEGAEVPNTSAISGSVLMSSGIELPLMHPQSALIFHLRQH